MPILTEKLRKEQADLKKWYGSGYKSTQDLLIEAADEIERLEKYIEGLTMQTMMGS